MRGIYIYILLLCVYVASSLNSHANPTTIKVGVFDYYPSLFKNEKGEIDGYYNEAFREIEQQENIHFIYKHCSRKECIELLQLGVIDIVPNIEYDTSIAKTALYSKQHLTTIWGELYVTQNSSINTIQDVSNKTIACLPHDVATMNVIEVLSKFGIHYQIQYCNSYDEIFQKVRTSQVDAGLVTNIFGAMKQEDFTLRPTDIVFNPFNVYVIGTKKHKEIIHLIDSYLTQWRHNEQSIYFTARQKWIYDSFYAENSGIPGWIFWMIGIVFVLSASIIYIVILFRRKVQSTALQIIEKQDAIKKTETKFKTYIDNSPIAVFIINKKGDFVMVNDSTSDISGYSKKELLKMNITQLIQQDVLDAGFVSFEELKTKGRLFKEALITCKTGNKIWIEIHGVKVTETEYFCFASDIHERKMAELQILEQTEEIKLQNIELMKAKQIAEESDRLKTAFLQNMSHEIRTPLNAIMGFSQLLPDYFDDKATLEKFCNIIQDRGEDLLLMINDVLHIAKIESGQISLYLSNTTIETIQNELIENFTEIKKRLDKTAIDIKFVINQELLEKQIIVDAIKLKQIFTNLIHNAIKFTNEGSVTITVSDKKTYLDIMIVDTGIGISKENLKHIFNKFTQVHNSGKAQLGTGLGLSIVKGLLDHLQGTIHVSSEVHKGTAFFITFPYAEPKENIEKPRQKTKTTELFKTYSTLVIEDEEHNAEFLKNILTPLVKTVKVAKDGTEAIEQLQTNHIDVIFLDIRLPGISGLELAKTIRLQYPHIYIIAQTAYTSEEDKDEAFNSGCHDYLTKPIQRNDVIEVLQKV